MLTVNGHSLLPISSMHGLLETECLMDDGIDVDLDHHSRLRQACLDSRKHGIDAFECFAMSTDESACLIHVCQVGSCADNMAHFSADLPEGVLDAGKDEYRLGITVARSMQPAGRLDGGGSGNVDECSNPLCAGVAADLLKTPARTEFADHCDNRA